MRTIRILPFAVLAVATWPFLAAAQSAAPDPGDAAKPAAATAAPAEDEDPLEPVNRFTFKLNQVLRNVIINPLVDVYQAVTPDPVEHAVSNATKNLTEPVTAASSLLQGDTENAGLATKRFLVNSTVGLAGTRDVAAEEYDLKDRQEDLGQAAGSRGMTPGPYLVLPIIGPSTTRDAAGDIATSVAVPPAGLAAAADKAATYSDNKDAIDSMTKGALDPYIVEREAYMQHRHAQILNSQAAPMADIPEFDEEVTE